MLFPIGDTQVEIGHKPYVSKFLLFINIAIFIYEISLGERLNNFIVEYGAIPDEIKAGEDLYTLFTNMFLHGGFGHIIGNMLFLWIFGDNIEATIGSLKFTIFYLIGGVIASLTHVVIDPNSAIPSIGASGAIAAVMGAYMIMFPKNKINMVFIIFFKRFQISALLFLGIWFAQNLISGLGIFSITESGEGGTAWWAHIGGFVFGLIMGRQYKFDYMKIPPSRAKYVDNNRKFVR